MTLDPGVFKAYDVRGVYGTEIDEAGAELIGRAFPGVAGATRIVVVPIFMAAGSHVKKDLPRLAADAMDRHPGLLIELAAPVGEVDSVLAAMADYAMNAQPATP